MLQEQLPESESFNLRHEVLRVLRRAMRSADRTRGTEMVDRFAAVFNDNRVKFYSKPGFSEDWFTDNVYIFDPRYNQAWIVVMSSYPGRSSLNSAATAIAKIVSSLTQELTFRCDFYTFEIQRFSTCILWHHF